MTLPFQDARTLADGARARALELGKALSIAVVDYGGFVVLIERMDGARPMTPDIALSKANSAAVIQRPTEMLENWRNSDPVFFTQVGRMGQHPIVATKGGYTLKRDGAILGGIGISGGSPDEDQQLCESVVYDQLDGFQPASGPQPLAGAAGIPPGRRRTAPADLQPPGRLAADEVAPVLAQVDRPVFVALPSPGYLAAVGSALADSAAADEVRARGEALAAILRGEIEALARDGVVYVALGVSRQKSGDVCVS